MRQFWIGLAAVVFAAQVLLAAPAPLKELDRAAKSRTSAEAWIPLADRVTAPFESLEAVNSDRVPNYLKALQSTAPAAAGPFAHLIKSVLLDGEIAPETKMAMGLTIAQAYGSPYVAAHAQRWLRSSQDGQKALAAIAAGNDQGLPMATQLAIRYAESLNGGVLGVSEEQFRNTRAYYNDGQVVELTLTVCFFNYFVRLSEGLHLPVEPWALTSDWSVPKKEFEPPLARVRLISDDEIAWAAQQAGDGGGEARGLPNSMRAMMQSPEIASAWRSYWGSTREGSAADRELMLHVSFAVSMANGCRYCTLHQVRGLRRLGVEPAKLMQMKKDDSALTARERTAVLFARKLTADPMSITADDFAALKAEFGGDRGALDVLLQTCSFAFMNRFTDGLRLPSEDDAIQIYRETYGGDFERTGSE